MALLIAAVSSVPYRAGVPAMVAPAVVPRVTVVELEKVMVVWSAAPESAPPAIRMCLPVSELVNPAVARWRWYGGEAGAVVVPASGGLVPPPGVPAQREGELARVISLASAWPARRVSRTVSATDSLIGAIRGGRARLAAADGNGSFADGNHQVSVVHVLVLAVCAMPGPSSGAAARVMSPHRASRMAAWQSWARAACAVCRQAASQVRAWELGPSLACPSRSRTFRGQRHPAMVME